MVDKIQEKKDLLKKIQKSVKGRNEAAIKDFVDGLLELYNDCSAVIQMKLLKHLRKEQWYSHNIQLQLLRSIHKEAQRYITKSQKYVKGEAFKFVDKFTDETLNDVKAIQKARFTKAWHLSHNKKITEAFLIDTMEHVGSRMLQLETGTRSFLQRKSQEVFRRASVEGLTRKQASKLLMDDILKDKPLFQFIDRRGRRWDNKTYFEMLGRTVFNNTQNNIKTETLVQEGNDLVIISKNGATDPCKNWEGKIISLTGATKGYPTYEEAFASGEVFHPRCRHTFHPWNPELEEFEY